MQANSKASDPYAFLPENDAEKESKADGGSVASASSDGQSPSLKRTSRDHRDEQGDGEPPVKKTKAGTPQPRLAGKKTPNSEDAADDDDALQALPEGSDLDDDEEEDEELEQIHGRLTPKSRRASPKTPLTVRSNSSTPTSGTRKNKSRENIVVVPPKNNVIDSKGKFDPNALNGNVSYYPSTTSGKRHLKIRKATAQALAQCVWTVVPKNGTFIAQHFKSKQTPKSLILALVSKSVPNASAVSVAKSVHMATRLVYHRYASQVEPLLKGMSRREWVKIHGDSKPYAPNYYGFEPSAFAEKISGVVSEVLAMSASNRGPPGPLIYYGDKIVVILVVAPMAKEDDMKKIMIAGGRMRASFIYELAVPPGVEGKGASFPQGRVQNAINIDIALPPQIASADAVQKRVWNGCFMFVFPARAPTPVSSLSGESHVHFPTRTGGPLSLDDDEDTLTPPNGSAGARQPSSAGGKSSSASGSRKANTNSKQSPGSSASPSTQTGRKTPADRDGDVDMVTPPRDNTTRELKPSSGGSSSSSASGIRKAASTGGAMLPPPSVISPNTQAGRGGAAAGSSSSSLTRGSSNSPSLASGAPGSGPTSGSGGRSSSSGFPGALPYIMTAPQEFNTFAARPPIVDEPREPPGSSTPQDIEQALPAFAAWFRTFSRPGDRWQFWVLHVVGGCEGLYSTSDSDEVLLRALREAHVWLTPTLEYEIKVFSNLEPEEVGLMFPHKQQLPAEQLQFQRRERPSLFDIAAKELEIIEPAYYEGQCEFITNWRNVFAPRSTLQNVAYYQLGVAPCNWFCQPPSVYVTRLAGAISPLMEGDLVRWRRRVAQSRERVRQQSAGSSSSSAAAASAPRSDAAASSAQPSTAQASRSANAAAGSGSPAPSAPSGNSSAPAAEGSPQRGPSRMTSRLQGTPTTPKAIRQSGGISSLQNASPSAPTPATSSSSSSSSAAAVPSSATRSLSSAFGAPSAEAKRLTASSKQQEPAPMDTSSRDATPSHEMEAAGLVAAIRPEQGSGSPSAFDPFEGDTDAESALPVGDPDAEAALYRRTTYGQADDGEDAAMDYAPPAAPTEKDKELAKFRLGQLSDAIQSPRINKGSRRELCRKAAVIGGALEAEEDVLDLTASFTQGAAEQQSKKAAGLASGSSSSAGSQNISDDSATGHGSARVQKGGLNLKTGLSTRSSNLAGSAGSSNHSGLDSDDDDWQEKEKSKTAGAGLPRQRSSAVSSGTSSSSSQRASSKRAKESDDDDDDDDDDDWQDKEKKSTAGAGLPRLRFTAPSSGASSSGTSSSASQRAAPGRAHENDEALAMTDVPPNQELLKQRLQAQPKPAAKVDSKAQAGEGKDEVTTEKPKCKSCLQPLDDARIDHTDCEAPEPPKDQRKQVEAGLPPAEQAAAEAAAKQRRQAAAEARARQRREAKNKVKQSSLRQPAPKAAGGDEKSASADAGSQRDKQGGDAGDSKSASGAAESAPPEAVDSVATRKPKRAVQPSQKLVDKAATGASFEDVSSRYQPAAPDLDEEKAGTCIVCKKPGEAYRRSSVMADALFACHDPEGYVCKRSMHVKCAAAAGLVQTAAAVKRSKAMCTRCIFCSAENCQVEGKRIDGKVPYYRCMTCKLVYHVPCMGGAVKCVHGHELCAPAD